jgi:hypothetical protein
VIAMNNIEKFLLFFCEPTNLKIGSDFMVFKLKSGIEKALGSGINKEVKITFSIPDDFSDIDFAAWLNDDIIATTQIDKGKPVTISGIKDALCELIETVDNIFKVTVI